jgi:hypothetical protein
MLSLIIRLPASNKMTNSDFGVLIIGKFCFACEDYSQPLVGRDGLRCDGDPEKQAVQFFQAQRSFPIS